MCYRMAIFIKFSVKMHEAAENVSMYKITFCGSVSYLQMNDDTDRKLGYYAMEEVTNHTSVRNNDFMTIFGALH